jgi:hypothetical protein
VSAVAAVLGTRGETIDPMHVFHCCVGTAGATAHFLCDTVFQAPSSLTRIATSFAPAWGVPLISPVLNFVMDAWSAGVDTEPGTALGSWASGSRTFLPFLRDPSKAGRRSLFVFALCVYRTVVLYLALGQVRRHYTQNRPRCIAVEYKPL